MTETQDTRTQAAAHTAADQASQLSEAAREQAGELASSARTHTRRRSSAPRAMKAAWRCFRPRPAVQSTTRPRQRTDDLARSVRQIADVLGAPRRLVAPDEAGARGRLRA